MSADRWTDCGVLSHQACVCNMVGNTKVISVMEMIFDTIKIENDFLSDRLGHSPANPPGTSLTHKRYSYADSATIRPLLGEEAKKRERCHASFPSLSFTLLLHASS